ncbi:MAG: glycosyltransferase [Methanothrix sp.]|nr:glycosyltransferase [Methanothrix sp.]
MVDLITILIVNYNGWDYLKKCLNSIFKVDKCGNLLEVIIINNSPTDKSAQQIQETFPEVNVIENTINNYAKALNLGVSISTGKYIAILNNDTIVEKNWLKELLKTINSEKDIGAAQSKILFNDEITINSVGVEEVEDFYFRDIGFNEKDNGKYNKPGEINFFTGGSVLLKRECIEQVGKFDEDFVIYMEDVDYSIRCKDLGWKIFYSPDSIVYHKYHGTASSKLCEYFCSRNRLLLLGKRYPHKLPESIKTSHLFLKGETSELCHSLLQAIRKLIDNNETEISCKVLRKLDTVVKDVFGTQIALNFFTQLEVVLGLRKIKIGIYDHAFHFAGGGQRYVAKIAEILQDNYDITYIANKECTLEKYNEWFGIDLSRCKLKIIKIPFYEKRDLYYIDEGRTNHENINPFDIISYESRNYDIFINANMLSKVNPLSCESLFICHFPDQDKNRFFSVDKYNYIITNSDYTTFWLRQKWDIEANLRLYPPVEMNHQESDPKNKKKIILSVARFEPGGSKKQIEMANAYYEICRKNKDIRDNWTLVLAGGSSGDNDYLKKVALRINFLEIKNIKLMPNVDMEELKNLYRSASIFWHLCGLNEVDPHRVEHFGMTTVEAMQNYCVPVVIDGGGQKEIVDHGVNGFRFNSIEELKAYTLKIINDDRLREDLSLKAFEKSQKFSSDIFKNQIIDFISNIEMKLRAGEALEVR